MSGKQEEKYYPVHDPAIFEDPKTHRFYLYCTEAAGFVSDDLTSWESIGRVVCEVPQEAKEWTGSDAIWAPDIIKVGDEYRLYCSNSSWGVQRSCIFLAVSDRPEGPFIPRAVVLKTDDTLTVNGIDANIIKDHESGEHYLLYGSFWGGIHLLPLDKKTGLARDAGEDGSGVGSLRLLPDHKEGVNIADLCEAVRAKRMGICLARRPLFTSGSVEGPYMIYSRETGYYYLFVSYGSLKNDYNIRVGRSKRICGPFLDHEGRDLADVNDDEQNHGLMIHAGYRWLSGEAFMGPGHNSVLQREDGSMFLVSHIRKLRFTEKNAGPGLLQIRRMFMTEDGWPVLSPEPYAGDFGEEELDIAGFYERIELRPMLPQGILHSHPLKLAPDGYLECCSIQGSYRRIRGNLFEFAYGQHRESVIAHMGYDAEEKRETILLSGLTNRGISTWAKRVDG